MLRIVFVLIIAVSLTACCGFKMRGSLDVPNYLRTICITPNEPYEPFQSELRTRLKQNDIKILVSPTTQTPILELSKFTSSDQVLAYGSSGEVQRYKLSVNVSYTLIVKGKDSLRLQRSITRSRELNRSNNMLLSNEGEAQIVKQELLKEAVSELLRQITARPSNKEPTASSSTTSDNPC